MNQQVSTLAFLAAAVLSAGLVNAQDSARLPVPDGVALKSAESKVRELFRDCYPAKDSGSRRNCAKRLLESAARQTNDTTLLYVLLQEAGDMASKAGDLAMTLDAAERLDRRFQVDGTGLKIERLKGLARAMQSLGAQAAYVRTYHGLILEAILERGHKDATQLTASATSVAEKSGCALLQEKVRFWKNLLEESRQEVAEIQAQQARLAGSPEDRTANLALGRFYCLLLEDWEKGLPMLVRSEDPAAPASETTEGRRSLGRLAEMDLRHPSEPAEQRMLGSAWIAHSKGEKGRHARSMALRGHRWRLKALQKLEGAEREQLDLALQEMPSRYLAEMAEFDVIVGHAEFRKDGILHTKEPILMHGFPTRYGLFFHPPNNGHSRVKYHLGGRYEKFETLVALCDRGKRCRATLTFSVHGDGKLLWSSSPTAEWGRAQKCKLNVARVEVLELRLDCRGRNTDALGAWIDPVVTRL